MKTSTLGGLVVAMVGVLAAESAANVIHVPADYPTIQAAVAAAIDGDTILVDAGTYSESVDFLGKAIAVTAVSADPSLTVIDAAAAGPAVRFQSGETSAALLEGFTLTGGSGVSIGSEMAGGNLFVSGARPTLRNLIVRDNLGGALGGGAYFSGSASKLSGVVFRNCTAGTSGGGLSAIDSSLTIEQCSFEDCYAISTGGGLSVVDCPSITLVASSVSGNQASGSGGMEASQTQLSISDCTFDQNRADEGEAGGMGLFECSGALQRCTFTDNSASYGAPGGGLFVYGDTPLQVEDCEFRSNTSSGFGSHIGVENAGGTIGPTITDCRFSDSESGVYVRGAALFEGNDFAGVSHGIGGSGIAVFDPGTARFVDDRIHGFDTGVLLYSTDAASLSRCRVTDNLYSGIEAYDGTATIEDCLVSGSRMGVYCENASLLVDGCTITRNFNPYNYPGGLLAVGTPAPTICNSIIWDNAPIELQDQTGGMVVVCYSDVAGGWAGSGNLDADPQFVDSSQSDFSLLSTSPCIDAADPAVITTRRDLFGRPRRLDGTLDRVERVDMGAFEFGHVTLAVTGNATPGGTITLTTSGNPKLAVLLFAGVASAEIDHPIVGTFYVDFAFCWALFPWGSPPSTVQQTLPADFPVPLTIHLQEAGVELLTRSGCTSNDVTLDVE